MQVRTMAKTPKYFMYFPGNYRWSAAFVNMLGRGSYGGADISELHKIGRLLEGKDAEDDEAWFDACVTIADEVRAHAQRFRASDHPVSAAGFYLRGAGDPDSPRSGVRELLPAVSSGRDSGLPAFQERGAVGLG
jgi:hypothetical protein